MFYVVRYYFSACTSITNRDVCQKRDGVKDMTYFMRRNLIRYCKCVFTRKCRRRRCNLMIQDGRSCHGRNCNLIQSAGV